MSQPFDFDWVKKQLGYPGSGAEAAQSPADSPLPEGKRERDTIKKEELHDFEALLRVPDKKFKREWPIDPLDY